MAARSHTPVDSFFKTLTLLIALFTVVRCVVVVQLTVIDLVDELYVIQAAEAPDTESEINSNGTTNRITVKKKRKFVESQNVYDFCIIIYKWIILYDLKVMKDRQGIFRNGFAVAVRCQNLNFVFYVQKTSIFLKDDMFTNFSVNFEPQRRVLS